MRVNAFIRVLFLFVVLVTIVAWTLTEYLFREQRYYIVSHERAKQTVVKVLHVCVFNLYYTNYITIRLRARDFYAVIVEDEARLSYQRMAIESK